MRTSISACGKKLLMFGVLMPMMALAYETETIDGITWNYVVSNGKAFVGNYGGTAGAVARSTVGAITIPSTLGGRPVVAIADYAFAGCGQLTSVVIPDSVLSIESYAFNLNSSFGRFAKAA